MARHSFSDPLADNALRLNAQEIRTDDLAISTADLQTLEDLEFDFKQTSRRQARGQQIWALLGESIAKHAMAFECFCQMLEAILSAIPRSWTMIKRQKVLCA